MAHTKKLNRLKSRSIAGYRLHDKRISQTSRTGAIRTIKYELRSSNKLAEERLAESVLHDYVHLYGPMDLFSMKQFGESAPNIVDIWFSFLRKGGVFQSREEDLYSLGELRSGTSGTVALFKEFMGEDLLVKLGCVEDQLPEFLKSLRARGGELGTERAAKKLRRSFPKIEEYCLDTDLDFLVVCKAMDPTGESKGDVRLWFPDVMEFFTGVAHDFPVRLNDNDCAVELKSLTAAFIPELEIKSGLSKHDDMESIIIGRKEWLEKLGVEPKDVLIDDLLGINSGTNALSHFFSRLLPFLQSKTLNIDDVVGAMDQRIGYTDDERAGVRNNLSIFSQEIADLPAPKAISGKWGDYRADFNGTIASWVANNVRRSGEIKELIPLLVSEIELIVEELNQYRESTIADTDELTRKKELLILDQCQELQNILREMKSGGYAKLFPLYRDQIAFLRDELNHWGQFALGKLSVKALKDANLEKLAGGKLKKGDESEKQWHVNKAFPIVCKDLPDIPVFFGENKKVKIQKHKDALKLIKAGFEYSYRFLQLLSEEKNEIKLTPSDIEKIRKCYAKCSTRRKDELKVFLSSCLDDQGMALLSHPNSRFHVTGFERNKTLKLLEAKSYPTLDQTTDLLADLVDVAEGIHAVERDWDLLIDTLELAKTIFAIYLNNVKECKSFNALTADITKLFPVYAGYLSIDENDTKPDSVNRNMQRFLFSEVRGAIQQAAKTRAICRSAIQSTNGEQGAVLVTRKVSDPKSISEGQMLDDARTRHLYYSMDIDGEIDTVSNDIEFLRIKKSRANATTLNALVLELYKVPKTNELFEIRSSKHQIQFLRWLCEKPKRKSNRLALQGGFVIAEHEYQMSWDQNLELDLKLYSGNREPRRVFVSLPFSVVPETEKDAVVFSESRFVGVDVGEYGLAVSAIDVLDGKVKVLDQAFLNDPQYRALQKEVDVHRKDRQVRATASQVTTRVARLRESVIGSYRNQLHQLSLKYQGRLVFENEISAFETAGQQIKKIYASIKQADVYSQIDAHKLTLNHSWGKWKKDGFSSGVEIGAAGTSRMCTCCNRWADILLKKDHLYKVERVPGYGDRLGKVQIGEKTVMVAELANDVTELTSKKVSLHMYKFMRPPMVDPQKPSAAVQYRIATHNQHDLAEQVSEMTNRGNQALYLCPFEDCCHFSDADLQASFTIALKRYLREFNNVEGFYDRADWVEHLQVFAKNNEVPKIGVRPQRSS